MPSMPRKIICLALLSLALAACSGRNPRAVEVTLDSYSLTLSKAKVTTGKIAFSVHNNSEIDEHEFIVVQTPLPANQLPALIAPQVSEDVLIIRGRLEPLPPGATRTLTLRLETGHYVLLCDLPGHFQKGMSADINVVP